MAVEALDRADRGIGDWRQLDHAMRRVAGGTCTLVERLPASERLLDSRSYAGNVCRLLGALQDADDLVGAESVERCAGIRNAALFVTSVFDADGNERRALRQRARQ